MENLTASAEEILIDSLSFKLPGSGNYVTDRRSVTFHTEGGDSYSATQGTKVIRFRLNGDGWLDPSTLRIMFEVVNTDPDVALKLRPVGQPHAFIKRLRTSIRGQVIEDIDNFNRVSELFHILQSPESRLNDNIEGFGYSKPVSEMNNAGLFPGILTTKPQAVMFKPLSGLFNQQKYLPLRYCPIELELELANADEPIARPIAGTVFTAANTSVQWKLQNCMIKVDLCTLDNTLDNSYTSHMLSGKSLNIVYDTYISSLQTIVDASSQINVSRSLGKMKSIFVTLDKNFVATTARDNYYMKQFNNFWSPNAGDSIPTAITHDGDKFNHFQIQLGSKLYPEYPIRSHAECFYSLRKALGVHANNLHNIDINGLEYRSNKFILGIDTEKLLGLSFTGANTRNALMTVHLKTEDGVHQANRMHIVLLSEQILEIGDAGVTVYD